MGRKAAAAAAALIITAEMIFALYLAAGRGAGSAGSGSSAARVHTHTYGDYEANEYSHWRVCADCGERSLSGAHVGGGVCDICGYAFAPTEGLEYELSGSGYTVTGAGSFISGTIVVPNEHNGLPVTAIGESAFAYSSAVSVALPSSVKTVSDRAFYMCTKLTSVTLGSASGIGESAFEWCMSLKSLEIPASVALIGPDAFARCTSLTNVTFAEPSGWRAVPSVTSAAGDDIPASSLGRATAAATLGEYSDCFLVRSGSDG